MQQPQHRAGSAFRQGHYFFHMQQHQAERRRLLQHRHLPGPKRGAQAQDAAGSLRTPCALAWVLLAVAWHLLGSGCNAAERLPWG